MVFLFYSPVKLSFLRSALDVDFVTWRGHLTKLLTTPYETREGWLLAVTRFRGTLYISEVETEAACRERESRSERHVEMMYWGYKFEQYTCAGLELYVMYECYGSCCVFWLKR